MDLQLFLYIITYFIILLLLFFLYFNLKRYKIIFTSLETNSKFIFQTTMNNINVHQNRTDNNLQPNIHKLFYSKSIHDAHGFTSYVINNTKSIFEYCMDDPNDINELDELYKSYKFTKQNDYVIFEMDYENFIKIIKYDVDNLDILLNGFKNLKTGLFIRKTNGLVQLTKEQGWKYYHEHTYIQNLFQ